MESEVLKRMAKRTPVDIEFENLRYCVGKKEILNSINGNFGPGRLTAILGSSGAGKTTLLNILAGRVQNGVTGDIRINGKSRELKIFRKISCYLMQDDLLRPLLTVTEAMTVSANLKLGNLYSSKDKEVAVKAVINLLGLEKCCNTMVENLSGGERKRVSIALEIISNPVVLFLDEPTTGLDCVMARTFIEFLKSTISNGRTIIFTIHQPSEAMFQLFDQAYFMSNGYCIYNGDATGVVPFLFHANLTCPSNYSPSDYIIELIHFEKENSLKLRDAVENGRIYIRRRNEDIEVIKLDYTQKVYADQEYLTLGDFPTSYWDQSITLISRTFMQMRRDKVLLIIQFLPALLLGVLVGLLFYDVGNDGGKLIHNINLFLGITFNLLYQQAFPQILLFPFEMKYLQREYSNRWYSLNAYYTALSVNSLPLVVIPTIVFVIPVYFLTDQPLDRFPGFVFNTVLVAMVAQSLGYVIGSLMPPRSGAVIGSAVLGTLILLTTFGVDDVGEVNLFKKLLNNFNFARQGFAVIMIEMLQNRDLLNCKETVCYFRDPEIGLRMFGMENQKYYTTIIYLILFLFFYKICIYLFLRFRLSSSYNFKLAKYFEYLEQKFSSN